MKLEITSEYEQAIQSMWDNQLTCILGQAGTGKSQLLSHLEELVEAHNDKLNIDFSATYEVKTRKNLKTQYVKVILLLVK